MSHEAARSWLFTPATRAERFAKAGEVGADVMILDLEDAVAPADKAEARRNALDYLSDSGGATLRALRINGLDTPAGIADLDALLSSPADADFVVLPKTESASHLVILDRLLAAARKSTRLVGLVESARGLAKLEEIALSTPRLGHVEALKLYYFEATAIAGKTVIDFDLADRIEPYCMFVTASDRAMIKKSVESERKVLRYVPNNFHQAPRLMIEDIGIDTFVCAVSPMDAHGFMSFGVGNDYSSKVARSAKTLIVEVNRNMPRVLGSGAQLHVSEVSSIVENHVPLLELPVRGGSPEDETISKLIAEMVPDGACLQMGVGALPNLVCAQLKNRNDLGGSCPGWWCRRVLTGLPERPSRVWRRQASWWPPR